MLMELGEGDESSYGEEDSDQSEEDKQSMEEDEMIKTGNNYMDGQQAAEEVRKAKDQQECLQELNELKDSDGEEMYGNINKEA